MLNIDRTSPVPLYHQLKIILDQKIEQDEWRTGDMIPSELELQDVYGLSRTTVRLALGEMVNEGRLVRQRGRGTFVSQPKLSHDPASGIPLSQYIVGQGATAQWQVLNRDWVIPVEDVQKALSLPAGVGVYRAELLLSADNTPIGHHTVYVPQPALANVPYEEYDDNYWLSYLRNLPRAQGYHVQRTIEAINLSGQRAGLLNIDDDAPVLSIRALATNEDGTPVQLILACFNGERFKYQITI